MSTFLETAEKHINSEKDNLSECHSKFISTMKFYQYSPKGPLEECSPKEFFDLWSQFCVDFKDIWIKEEQKKIKEKWVEFITIILSQISYLIVACLQCLLHISLLIFILNFLNLWNYVARCLCTRHFSLIHVCNTTVVKSMHRALLLAIQLLRRFLCNELIVLITFAFQQHFILTLTLWLTLAGKQKFVVWHTLYFV